MANTGRITQSVVQVASLVNGNARLTQSIVQVLVGLGIVCNNPPNGTVGSPYTHTFLAGSGTAPYSFSITAGSLPPGLTLAATGVVTGTPTAPPGTFAFTVTVTDSLTTTASVNCSITILSAPGGGFVSGGGPKAIPRPCQCDAAQLALEQTERLRRMKSGWPFPSIFPSRSARRVTIQGSILVPAVGVLTEGLAFTVDQGYQFALEKLVVQFYSAGAVGVADPGSFLWSLDLNAPIGVSNFIGSPVQGFTQVDVPLGSVVLPWPLAAPEVFAPNDCLRCKFLNVSLGPGAPNYFKVLLLGWLWPE